MKVFVKAVQIHVQFHLLFSFSTGYTKKMARFRAIFFNYISRFCEITPGQTGQGSSLYSRQPQNHAQIFL